MRKISPLSEIRSPYHPARSKSLYWLSYRGPPYMRNTQARILNSILMGVMAGVQKNVNSHTVKLSVWEFLIQLGMYDVFFGQGTWNGEGYSRYLAYGKCEIIALRTPATVYSTCGTPQRGKSMQSFWNFYSFACMLWHHRFQWPRHVKLYKPTSVSNMLRRKYTHQLIFCPFKCQFHDVVNSHITLFLPNLHKQARWRMLRVFRPRK